MRTRLVVLLAGVVLAVGVLAGCGSSGPGGDTHAVETKDPSLLSTGPVSMAELQAALAAEGKARPSFVTPEGTLDLDALAPAADHVARMAMFLPFDGWRNNQKAKKGRCSYFVARATDASYAYTVSYFVDDGDPDLFLFQVFRRGMPGDWELIDYDITTNSPTNNYSRVDWLPSDHGGRGRFTVVVYGFPDFGNSQFDIHFW